MNDKVETYKSERNNEKLKEKCIINISEIKIEIENLIKQIQLTTNDMKDEISNLNEL